MEASWRLGHIPLQKKTMFINIIILPLPHLSFCYLLNPRQWGIYLHIRVLVFCRELCYNRKFAILLYSINISSGSLAFFSNLSFSYTSQSGQLFDYIPLMMIYDAIITYHYSITSQHYVSAKVGVILMISFFPTGVFAFSVFYELHYLLYNYLTLFLLVLTHSSL